MAQKRWRIGIIGCGWAGNQHAHAFQVLSDRAELVVTADNKRDAAEHLAGEYGIPRVITDYADVLAMGDVDAVSLCLPHQFHAPAAIASISNSFRSSKAGSLVNSACFVEQGRKPTTSVRKERKPLVAVIATYESFRRGERVYLAEMESAT